MQNKPVSGTGVFLCRHKQKQMVCNEQITIGYRKNNTNIFCFGKDSCDLPLSSKCRFCVRILTERKKLLELKNTNKLESKLKKALNYQLSGQATLAGKIYDEILCMEPAQPDALHLKGIIAYEREEFEKAEALIIKAIHGNPGMPDYYQSLGTVLKAHGKTGQAISAFLAGLNLNPDNADVWYETGRLFEKTGSTKKALFCFNEALEKDKNHLKSIFKLANAFRENGRHEKSIELLKKFISQRPESGEAYNNLGLCFASKGAVDESIRCYQRALAINPCLLEAHLNLGVAYHRSNQYLKAIDSLNSALKVDASCTEVYYNMGICLDAIGKATDALSCYDKAIEHHPEFVEAHNNKGVILQYLGKIDIAIDCFKSALKLDPDNAVAFYNLGLLYKFDGDLKTALFYTKCAVEKDAGYSKAAIALYEQSRDICDWKQANRLYGKLEKMITSALKKNEVPEETPFSNLIRVMDPKENFEVARAWSSQLKKEVQFMGVRFVHGKKDKNKLTIGYLSNNFRDHPTAHLIQDIFRFHDKSRFSIHCYSYGEDDKSPYRKTIKENCDQFLDLNNRGPVAAAKKIHRNQVEILVD